MRDRFVLPCYLLLAAVYLFYLPYAEFVLDDWFMVQKFEQARTQGPRAEWALAGALARNQVWGASRANWLSFVGVFGLYQIAGPHPAFYFLLGLSLHAAIGYLLFLTLARLELDRGMSFLAGAFFLLLPTVHNPLFWIPNCGQYLFAAFWFMVYLYSVAGTVVSGKLHLRAALLQFVALTLALFSTDQALGLLLFAAPWLALCWRSRAAPASTLLAWGTIGAAGAFYFRFVNTAKVAGSVAAKFDFTALQLSSNLRAIWSDYGRLAGFSDGYYRLTAIGWGSLGTAAAGLLVFWWLRSFSSERRMPVARPLLLGAGLWIVAYGPVLFLRFRELRYDYLPSLGLAVVLATALVALFRERPHRWLAAGAALLLACSAAAAFADIQQCWKPQSKNLQAIKQRLRQLEDVKYHDVVAVSNAPTQIGTAPHFAMFLSYSSTPFVETVTGVWGLVVGREIYCESGRLGLQHTDFMHALQYEDLARTHVLVSDGDQCHIRTLMACEVRPGLYELHPLKGYAGPPLAAGRAYSRRELARLGSDAYFALHHPRPTPER